MLAYFAKWNDLLNRRMFILVLSAVLIGFNLSINNEPIYSTIATISIAYMTFVTAIGTSFRDFLRILTKPWIPMFILFLIHFVAPLVAWIVGQIMFPGDTLIQIGFLVGASIPIAVTSIIWTAISNGKVALAIVAVTLDTLIVPFLLPSFFALVLGKTLHINYLEMTIQLFWMVTLPSILGMLFQDVASHKTIEFWQIFGGLTSKMALFFVILINAGVVAPQLQWNIKILKLLLTIFILVLNGYLLGFLGSFIIKKRQQELITAMIFSVGMRNISFGLVLALTHFPPGVAIPVILAMLFQQPVAAGVSYLINKKNRYVQSFR